MTETTGRGFWPNCQPPANEVLKAIQYPLDERWQNRVLNGVLADALSMGKSHDKPEKSTKPTE